MMSKEGIFLSKQCAVVESQDLRQTSSVAPAVSINLGWIANFIGRTGWNGNTEAKLKLSSSKPQQQNGEVECGERATNRSSERSSCSESGGKELNWETTSSDVISVTEESSSKNWRNIVGLRPTLTRALRGRVTRRSASVDLWTKLQDKPPGRKRGISLVYSKLTEEQKEEIKKEREEAKKRKAAEESCVPYPPSMVKNGFTINGTEKRKYGHSTRTEVGKRKNYGISDTQLSTYLRKTGFQEFCKQNDNEDKHPLSGIGVWKGNTIVILPGAVRLCIAMNTINTNTTKKGYIDGVGGRNSGQSHAHMIRKYERRRTFSYLTLDHEQWDSIVNYWKLGKQIIIMLTRVYASTQRLGKRSPFRVELDFSSDKMIIKDAPKHIGFFLISGRKVLYYDSYNYPFVLEKWVRQYYVLVKDRALTLVLRKFGIFLRDLELFDIPVTSFSYSVSNSCSHYVLFAIEQLAENQSNTDFNKTKALGALFFEKVAHFVGCHTPFEKYKALHPNWIEEDNGEFIYENLLKQIANSERSEYSLDQLNEDKEAVRVKILAENGKITYQEIVYELEEIIVRDESATVRNQ